VGVEAAAAKSIIDIFAEMTSSMLIYFYLMMNIDVK
jgi:hypothetical protein